MMRVLAVIAVVLAILGTAYRLGGAGERQQQRENTIRTEKDISDAIHNSNDCPDWRECLSRR